jgi:hypothetical protein
MAICDARSLPRPYIVMSSFIPFSTISIWILVVPSPLLE